MALIRQDVYDRIVSVRRWLHRYPELSGRETNTAAVIADFLQGLDVPYCTNVAGTGVMADIPGTSGVPCVVLRADTDALPIHEETGLEFASVHAGVKIGRAHV